MERLHINFHYFRSSEYFLWNKQIWHTIKKEKTVWAESGPFRLTYNAYVGRPVLFGKGWGPSCKMFWERRLDDGCYFSKVKGLLCKKPATRSIWPSVRRLPNRTAAVGPWRGHASWPSYWPGIVRKRLAGNCVRKGRAMLNIIGILRVYGCIPG
jgi:hypothetical protein